MLDGAFLRSWDDAAVFALALVEGIHIPIPSAFTLGFAGALAGEGHIDLAVVMASDSHESTSAR
jgi:membrane protein DedA with SNARE-associated domain